MLRFTLLGPMQVIADGTPLTGIAPRHRAVLGYLLLNAGRVISLERLIDAMWGHDRPDTARSQIHASITAIRRVLRGVDAADRTLSSLCTADLSAGHPARPGASLELGGSLVQGPSRSRLRDGTGRQHRRGKVMSIDLTENSITEEVQSTFDGCRDARTRELFVALVRHLHDYTREVRLTGEEWFTAMDFLERVGKITTATRQEYVLLSDILGVSVLVDLINDHSGPCTTDSTLLGPFYVEGRPAVPNGADISAGRVPGMPLFFTGRVATRSGDPVAGARVDTWHSDGEGHYDVQQAERLHGHLAMRALLTTDEEGRFWYRSIAPRYYPVPTDGPGGEIIRAAGRSPMRPEHIHFWLHAEGYEPLITMLVRSDDPYLNHDAVFAVKRSLVVDFVQREPGTAPDGTVVKEPFQTVDWTFTLSPNAG
ncbi:hypothetical protein Acor_29240 [Acrocarpospora corrugata]|uniref:OmpR/PhoB-type domain-containing protein n=1 Tax=Acrocarpospora corrugata TaxID=35763 RepID=A0A5M3VY63_9ACTN|nr:dioxygenase [Acrocarpospora corrugata]GES00860.1 hypothetical protein Acor_29240 [Acrocarpospora corrugata]